MEMYCSNTDKTDLSIGKHIRKPDDIDGQSASRERGLEAEGHTHTIASVCVDRSTILIAPKKTCVL